MRRRVMLRGFVVVGACAGMVAASRAAVGAEPAGAGRKNIKYYFKVVEIGGDVDTDTKALARGLLEKELSGRPEFVAEPAEGLRGFNVSLKFETMTKKLGDPRPGGRLKQMAVSAGLSIFGAEIPTQKLAFSGSGEAMVEGEVIERKLAEETRGLVEDVVGRAIKEAVDQAVLKLSLPQSEPPGPKKKAGKTGSKTSRKKT